MRAYARVVAEADGHGGTRLVRLRGEPPLLPRRTGTGTGPATVHLVGGAAGPLGGDELRLDIEVGALMESLIATASVPVIETVEVLVIEAPAFCVTPAPEIATPPEPPATVPPSVTAPV